MGRAANKDGQLQTMAIDLSSSASSI